METKKLTNATITVAAMSAKTSVIVIKGKHTGNTGKIEEIIERGGKKLVKISSDDKKINVWVKNIILTE